MDDSPSALRRKALQDAHVMLFTINPKTPIATYLDLAQELLSKFDLAKKRCELDNAYIFGKRFASLCLNELPKHPEYSKSTFVMQKKQAQRVCAGLESVITRMDEEELTKQTWFNVFAAKDSYNRIRITATIRKTRIGVVGETGHGKTTSIGMIIDNPEILGKSGWSHDTNHIAEYQLNTIEPDGDIHNRIFVDTRGTNDTGANAHYTATDLFIDMNTYTSKAEESKVIFVINYRRLQPGPLKMLNDLYKTFQNNYMILITGTMDRDGNAKRTLRAKLNEKGIGFSGSIICVDWVHQDVNVIARRRSQILHNLIKVQKVDVRRLSRRGVCIKLLEQLEQKFYKVYEIEKAGNFVLMGIGAIASAAARCTGSTMKSIVGLIVICFVVQRLWTKRKWSDK